MMGVVQRNMKLIWKLCSAKWWITIFKRCPANYQIRPARECTQIISERFEIWRKYKMRWDKRLHSVIL